jgi:ABC-type transport system involved in cytochrome c biogenesis permease subunit
MNGVGTATLIVGWTLGLAVGMVALGGGLFALSVWSNRAAGRFFQAWDVRKAAARLVSDIYCAHFRYRAGHDITAGARSELP